MKTLLIIMWLTTIFIRVLHAGEWELVWSDEFNYEGLPDTNKWSYEEGFVRNYEEQYYTKAREENVRVKNGKLIIEGRKEDFQNSKYRPGSKTWKENRQVASYTAGSINTLGKQAFLYGRLEVRAKMPKGKGMWPAIWMMGTNFTVVGWPRCGEIDIMEYVGKEPHRIHSNNHFADPKIKDESLRGRGVHMSSGGKSIHVQEPYRQFHVYTIEWDEKETRFFVDEEQFSTFNIDMAGEGASNPFRKPHYLLLNLALGGNWGGEIDDSVLPQKYEVDYIRYYKVKTGQQSPEGDGQRTASEE